ncbi:hypothetical protein B0T22DRAFT_453843 [Podospora appendiculata]|uniref:Uncharacterized protein n=1 Tax=Podospora appendiculata TaxID=314037 RepID=A0AAE0XK21_9PEZI|nr:hypothetical protein B0T22DRAFT_453843 [Podospora appendiculata]
MATGLGCLLLTQVLAGAGCLFSDDNAGCARPLPIRSCHVPGSEHLPHRAKASYLGGQVSGLRWLTSGIPSVGYQRNAPVGLLNYSPAKSTWMVGSAWKGGVGEATVRC